MRANGKRASLPTTNCRPANGTRIEMLVPSVPVILKILQSAIYYKGVLDIQF
jgi:hypothetical protein